MNAARRYRQTQATTASREEILLMLYDGALRFLDEAVDAFRRADPAAAGGRIGKVLAIVAELQGALDYRASAELCRTLDSLYMYITQRLLEANQHRSVRHLEEVRELLASLHATWRDAADIVRCEQIQQAGGGAHGKSFSAEA
jgi:flagellar protein FliS